MTLARKPKSLQLLYDKNLMQIVKTYITHETINYPKPISENNRYQLKHVTNRMNGVSELKREKEKDWLFWKEVAENVAALPE